MYRLPYQVRCKSTGKIYIGNTQQYFKKRIGAHLSDVKRLVLEGKKSDSFANHFASLCNSDTKPSAKTLRAKMEFSILWQGKPVSVKNSFGKKSCYLCMKERTHILKGMYSNTHSLINNNSEIYSSCRHKTRFHRFPNNSTGTDESTRGRKSSLSTSCAAQWPQPGPGIRS